MHERTISALAPWAAPAYPGLSSSTWRGSHPTVSLKRSKPSARAGHVVAGAMATLVLLAMRVTPEARRAPSHAAVLLDHHGDGEAQRHARHGCNQSADEQSRKQGRHVLIQYMMIAVASATGTAASLVNRFGGDLQTPCDSHVSDWRRRPRRPHI